ncbi:hypothetical protein [Clostridium sp. BJN0001]|uniref:hypothetical protein n=1 Tax=Clostridium sp. BJN0001 TaxID=2930219 RepID=UPI001FD34216|nr:hypothetical protein [Clostridium sp. BJN0001]
MLYKNNKKLIYKLLAQIVWLSVETYGRKFTPSYEELPSYLPDKERDTADKNSINFLNVIKYVVKNFQYRDLSIIESRLKELKDSKDPYALRSNRGKMSDGQRVHIAFSTKAGFPCRIFYKALKKHDDNKRIEITEIQKHNYSRYGK